MGQRDRSQGIAFVFPETKVNLNKDTDFKQVSETKDHLTENLNRLESLQNRVKQLLKDLGSLKKN
jgi:hypothetical protein